MRLQLTNGVKTDETLIYFDPAASMHSTVTIRLNLPKQITVTQIFTTAGTEKLVINGMKKLPLNQEIGLGFVPGNATTFSIKQMKSAICLRM